jgi:hypothetical protein
MTTPPTKSVEADCKMRGLRVTIAQHGFIVVSAYVGSDDPDEAMAILAAILLQQSTDNKDRATTQREGSE